MRAANRPLGKAAARRAMCAFLAITPLYGLVLDARLVRKILPVAGPAAAVIGSLVAVGEPADIFETAHVVVIVCPPQAQAQSQGILPQTDQSTQTHVGP